MNKYFRSVAFVFFFSLVFYLPKLNADTKLPFLEMGVEISMDFKDAELKDVLKVLSMQAGLNFIASESVQDRKITLYLDKVPLKNAMDKLFKANNLTYELDADSSIFIVKEWGKPKVETITKIFNLRYATVSTSPLLSAKSNQGSSSSSTSTSSSSSESSGGSSSGSGCGITSAIEKILSEFGSVMEDSRTNSLIVTETPNRMPVIAEIIKSLDVSVPQVMLEVEMLDVSKNMVDKLGFQYSENVFSVIASGATATTGFPFHSWSKPIIAPTYGSLSWSTNYGVALDFLRTQTDTKILARPRILTLNNETAEIKISTQETVGTVNTTSTGGGQSPVTTIQTERVETGVSLKVTPQVNLETGEVTMYIVPSVKDTTTSALSGVIAKDPEERSTKSLVRLKDGETVIIGGLIRNQQSQITSKVPILGDIPVIGSLFRHVTREPNKERELLVFITPRIMKDNNTSVSTGAKNMEVARAKNIIIPEREQNIIPVANRQNSIDTVLNRFDRRN